MIATPTKISYLFGNYLNQIFSISKLDLLKGNISRDNIVEFTKNLIIKIKLY